MLEPQLSWTALSEIVAGEMLRSKRDPKTVAPRLLQSPYDELVTLLQRGINDINRLVELVGLQAVNAAYAAIDSTNLPADWLSLLKRAAALHESGRVFEQLGRRMSRGEAVDLSPAIASIERLQREQTRLVPLSDVEEEQYKYRKTYYAPLDYHIGGLADHGMCVVGASPGTGKTSLLIEIACSFAASKESDGKVAIFTLEMTNGELLSRMLEIRSSKLSARARSRILVCDDSIPIDEIVAEASRSVFANDVKIVGIDFADLAVDAVDSEAVMAKIYRQCSTLAKDARVSVLLLSQLSRKYEGGVPRNSYLRYTGLAEALAYQILLLYNPRQTFVSQDSGNVLPAVPGKGYIIVGKCRGGYGRHSGPGAIQVDWDGMAGWGRDSGMWFPLEDV